MLNISVQPQHYCVQEMGLTTLSAACYTPRPSAPWLLLSQASPSHVANKIRTNVKR